VVVCCRQLQVLHRILMAKCAVEDFRAGAVVPFKCDAVQQLMLCLCPGVLALFQPLRSVKITPYPPP
jgi:hypothetical protein